MDREVENRKEIHEWKDALETKLQAEAMVEIAKKRDSFNAMKYLADKGWVERKDRKKRKKEKDELDSLIKEDMDRIGMSLN